MHADLLVDRAHNLFHRAHNLRSDEAKEVIHVDSGAVVKDGLALGVNYVGLHQERTQNSYT